MIWLTWRQHRLQAVTALGVLALLAIFLVVTGRQMTSYLHSTGLAVCLRRHASCGSLSQLFENRYGTLLNDIAYLNFLPMLAGMFWGAPLLAREYEQGTDILAWTQTVSRRRWLAVKLTAFTAAAIAAATGFSLLFGWWVRPVQPARRPRRSTPHPAQRIRRPGHRPHRLHAVRLRPRRGRRRHYPPHGARHGRHRRGFLAARISVQTLRGHLFTPLRSVHALVSPTGAVSLGTPLVGPQNWVLDSNVVDRSGHVVSDQTVLQTCRAILNPRGWPSASPPTATTSSTSTSRSAATGPFKASNSPSSPPSQSACSRLPSGPSPKTTALGGGLPPCAPSARPPSGLQRKLRPPFQDPKTRPRPGHRVPLHP
jgi:hypothetical protein